MISNYNNIYKCTFIMRVTVYFRIMVELITNIKVIASPLIEWENDTFQGVELMAVFN